MHGNQTDVVRRLEDESMRLIEETKSLNIKISSQPSLRATAVLLTCMGGCVCVHTQTHARACEWEDVVQGLSFWPELALSLS